MTRAATPTSSAAVLVTLVVETPGGEIEPRPLAREDFTIGRDARCDVSIDHPTVSRLHARLWRDAKGWHFQDLGSQNGSRLNASFVAAPASLVDGAELHIGRIRAWFFGENGIPESWRPTNDDAEHQGRLVRCRCGHIGWAPDHAAGMRLPCARCGRDLVIRERTAMPAAKPAECAACHSPINTGDASTTCPDCATQMHAECWRENRGCATYGCAQVGVEDRTDSGQPPTANVDSAPFGDSESEANQIDQRHAPTRTLPLDAALTILFALVGLLLFGAPSIAFAVYRALAVDESRPIAKRMGYAIASFLAGVFGFIASSFWWFGGIR